MADRLTRLARQLLAASMKWRAIEMGMEPFVTKCMEARVLHATSDDPAVQGSAYLATFRFHVFDSSLSCDEQYIITVSRAEVKR